MLNMDSTEDYDRGDKLSHYKQIPELQAVLIASHRRPQVTVIRRTPGGWEHTDARAGESIVLDTPTLSLRVDEIYAGIELTANA